MEPAREQTPAGRAVPPLGMAAIVIMATGFGWVGGNFSTATDTLPVKLAVTLGHLILPAVLAVLAGLLAAHPRSPAARRAVTVVAWLGVLFAAVSTGYALANPNPDAFGPHNLADYTAVVILLAGAVLWLLHRVVPAPRRGPRNAVGAQPAARNSR
jgi:predicted acyltransferase